MEDADEERTNSEARSNKSIDKLSAFAAEMKAMSDAHNAGDIDAVMPEEKFEGIYRTMAKSVNDRVRVARQERTQDPEHCRGLRGRQP